MQEIGLTDHDLGELLRIGAETGQPCRPVQTGVLLGQFLEAHEVVTQICVTTLDDVPMPGRDLLLEFEHTLCVVADAGEGEHLVDVRDVLLADLRVVVLAVVRLVGQADSRLAEVDQVPLGILGIGVDIMRDGTADADALVASDHGGQRRPVRRIGDGVQLVVDGAEARGLHGVGVHEARVQVADALCIGTGGRVGLRGFGDDGLYVFFGLVVERPEGPVDCAVCRNLVFGEPFSVDVDEQIVLRPCVAVEVGEVDA